MQLCFLLLLPSQLSLTTWSLRLAQTVIPTDLPPLIMLVSFFQLIRGLLDASWLKCLLDKSFFLEMIVSYLKFKKKELYLLALSSEVSLSL